MPNLVAKAEIKTCNKRDLKGSILEETAMSITRKMQINQTWNKAKKMNNNQLVIKVSPKKLKQRILKFHHLKT